MASSSGSSHYFSGAAEYAGSFNARSSRGASEHADWKGALAYSNIGLDGKAVRGSKWQKIHKPRLVKLVVELLRAKPLFGVLLNEVANVVICAK